MPFQLACPSNALEGGWLNPDLGDTYERGADLALTFHTTAAPERLPGRWGACASLNVASTPMTHRQDVWMCS